jgi:glycosyltransferase involved in cell wall biosynthesis
VTKWREAITREYVAMTPATTSPPMVRSGLARFPPPGRSVNPCLDLLDAQLTRLGVPVVPDSELSARWLWRSRHVVGLLHFHWRADEHYACLGQAVDDQTVRRPRLQRHRSWLRLAAFAGRLAAARALGYRLAWTIHEVYPNETELRPPGTISRRIDRAGGRLLASFSDTVLAHDHGTAERAGVELGVEGVAVVPHGSYVGVYPPGRSRADVREELDIPADAFVFLCFGDLRPDKELELVLDAFTSVEDPRMALVVAGRIKDERSARLVAGAAARDPRIRPVLGLVPGAQVAELFGASDVAVLGRSEAWTSGSLILALSLGVPVVASRLPIHEDLVGDGQAGWLFEPGDHRSLRESLLAAQAHPAVARTKGEAALRRAHRLPSWLEVAERTLALTVGV